MMSAPLPRADNSHSTQAIISNRVLEAPSSINDLTKQLMALTLQIHADQDEVALQTLYKVEKVRLSNYEGIATSDAYNDIELSTSETEDNNGRVRVQIRGWVHKKRVRGLGESEGATRKRRRTVGEP
ncbi:hypothetical protein RUND412_007899 [Rhizina undulata]